MVLAAVSAAICGAAASWWYQLAQWQNGTSIWAWRWSSFELTPLSLAGWTVLAMALALLCGVLIRRMLPAMIAVVVLAGVAVYVSQAWLRPWLFGLGTTVRRVSSSTSAGWPASTTTYSVRTWDQHGATWVAYQPHSHLVWLELARSGILVAVAALAVLAAAGWLRIRPAD